MSVDEMSSGWNGIAPKVCFFLTGHPQFTSKRRKLWAGLAIRKTNYEILKNKVFLKALKICDTAFPTRLLRDRSSLDVWWMPFAGTQKTSYELLKINFLKTLKFVILHSHQTINYKKFCQKFLALRKPLMHFVWA